MIVEAVMQLLGRRFKVLDAGVHVVLALGGVQAALNERVVQATPESFASFSTL